jgi:biotin-dependent carboxylase-like uncharacterized protein
MTAVRVVQVGWGTTVQDLGRTGYADVGVPRSGPVDRRSHDLVNRLVGNVADAATIETSRGFVIEAVTPATVATSSDGALRTLRANERLLFDAAAGEMWAYLAVRGGIEVTPVLGSRSHDTLSGLGPPPLRAGDLLSIGNDPGTDMPTDLAPHDVGRGVVRLWDGPQHDWFGSADAILGEWLVAAETSRVGVRLERPSQPSGSWPSGHSERASSMPSVGLVEGAVQVTPSGQPIVMLANHPTTGGYPVIAVVDPHDLPVVAQAPPGSPIRFRRV